MFNKLLAVLLVLSLSLYTVLVDAKSFGGGFSSGRSYSSSRSYSSPSHSYSSSGSSYSRPSTPSYTTTRSAPPTVIHNYGTQSSSPGWGGVAAGAIGGYMLGHSNSNNDSYNSNSSAPYGPGPAVQAPLEPMPAGTQAYDSSSHQWVQSIAQPVAQDNVIGSFEGIGNILKWVFFILLGGVAVLGLGWVVLKLWALVREKWNSNESLSDNIIGLNRSPEAMLEDAKVKLFTDFQLNNRPSGKDFIKSNTTSLFYNSIKRDVDAEPEDKDVYVKQLEATVLNVWKEGGQWIGSVKFKAILVEDTERSNINEIWNFELNGNKWLVSGIEA